MTTLLRSDALLEHDFPTPPMLIDPILPVGGISMLYGKPGVGKTQFLLTLCAAINNGEKLFGRWLARQGPCLIVQADMTSQMQQERLAKVVTSASLPDTYFVIEEDGSTPLIDITTMKLYKPELIDLMQEIDPVFTAWDTLRSIHMMSEKDDTAPPIIYRKAKEILPLSHHQFAHHSRKLSRDPDADEHIDEAFLGYQHWKSMADTLIYLEEVSSIPSRIKCQLTKCRTAPPTEKEPFMLELDITDMILRSLRQRSGHGAPSELRRWVDTATIKG